MLCAKRISLFAGDCHFRKVCLSGVLLLFFLLPAFSAQAYEWGAWTEDVAAAKTLALTHNRPILAVFGRAGCGYCQHLESQVLMQAEFSNYARDNKLVLFYCHNNDALLSRVTNNYQRECGISTSIPVFYFFKVKPGADLNLADYKALDSDHVSLLEISSGAYSGKKCAGVYRNTTINGIALGPEDRWDVPTFIQVIESFFPNRQSPGPGAGWDTVVPPPDGPIGYEGALDLGKVLTKDNPPANEMDWVLTSPLGSLSGASSERWYKFTGAEGRRYVLGATGIDMAASDGIHIKIEYFCSYGERPVYPVLEEVTSDGWDRLDRCIWLDSPIGSRTNQLYFLRLSHSGGSAATNLDYKLKLHQMVTKSPAVGAVSNPYWRGAHPGKWSMDVDAARAAALQNNKPVIFCFSGLRWCRFCVGAEHTAFADVAFNAALADAYLVVVDNRRRNGSGPSLLRENFAGGYLTANGITEAEAADKLDANLDLQNVLALPGASEWAPGRRRIGYPTFVYCRVQNTRSGVEFLPIGRFGYDASFTPTAANVDEAFRKIRQLKYLDSKSYLERSMFPETSQQYLDAGASPFSSYIGGLVTADWVKFSVARGKSFTAMIRARDANDDAQVALEVYKADGKTLLRRLIGNLRDGTVPLEFIPANAAGGDFWLSVSAVNQDTPVEYRLAYRQDQLKNQVSFARTEIPVARHEPSVMLTIHRQILMPEHAEPFSMQYRVVPRTASAEWFDSVDWQDLVWTEDEKASGKKELTLNIHVPEDAELRPEGYWDFRVEMRVIEGADHWKISQESLDGTLVKIYSKAVFALDEDLRELQLYAGLPFKLVIPICKGGDYDAVAVTNLPAGVVMAVPDNADPYLAGTPEDTVASTAVTLQLLNDGQETDRLTLQLSIQALNEALVDLVAKDAFAGFLHSGNQDITNPVGSLNLNKTENGTFTATVISKDSPEPVVFASPAGWSYDPRTGGLLLEFPEKDGNALTLRLSADGVGIGSFRSAEGEYPSSFYPATATPAEYAGYYTVALRFPDSGYDDAENYARGGLLLDIDADGRAIYAGEMEDGTTFFGETWIYDQENDAWGTVAFFAHLKKEDSSHGGYLGGLLAVAPKSIRITSNDACIADCGGTSVWVKEDGARIGLLPCGTVYDPARTLQAQIGDADGFFYIETRFPDGNAMFVPNRVKLQEAGNVLSNVSPPNVFGIKYSALTKDVNGVFFGTVDLLDGEILVKDVVVRGVLTPVAEDCCSIGSDLYVGYGYYRWNDQVFSIRLRSDEPAAPTVPMPELLELGGQTKEPFNYLFVNDALATISNPAKWLLYRKAGTADWSSAGAKVNILLESAFTWQFVAVNETMIESGILEIPLRKAEEVQVFNLTGEDGAVKLQPGWNLIAIPWNFIPAADAYPPPAGMFSYDPQRKVCLSALEWMTGAAYWLFVTEEFEGFSLLGETDDSAAVPVLARGVWHFMAWDDRLLDHVWHWNGEKFFYGVPAMPTDGVWGYIE